MFSRALLLVVGVIPLHARREDQEGEREHS